METEVIIRKARDGSLIGEGLLVYEKQRYFVKDFLYTKKAAISLLADLGYLWKQYAENISNNKSSFLLLNWIEEMVILWNTAIELKLRISKKKLDMKVIKDYFLTGFICSANNYSLFCDKLVLYGQKKITKESLTKYIQETILK